MHPIISISSLLGLVLPVVILFFNKGYHNANRYLAYFLFFISFYVLENFIFFYSTSIPIIVFATTIHSFFYLIGPFAFLYIRSILRGGSKIGKIDYLHFALFFISFLGYIPYFFTNVDYKFIIAENISGINWNMAPFHLNKLLPHKFDQVLNVLNAYFYMLALWYLIWLYKKPTHISAYHSVQHKLIQKWVLIFVSTFTIINVAFSITMVNLWIYDDKSLFLDRASLPLFLTSLIYIGMSISVMFFP